MKAVILAGGFGTRLKEIAQNVPKPMVLIAGKPFLEHLLLFLRDNGITEIILTVHHMANKIKSYFGTGHRWGLKITYSEEESPLGTAGAIKNAEKYIDDTFLVLNGDSYSQINIGEFIDFHKSKKSKYSIALTKVKEVSEYGGVIVQDNKIIEFSEKKIIEQGGGLVNSGIYIFEPKIFDYIEPYKNVSIEKDVFPRLAREGLLYGYQFDGYFMDLGRPETYNKFKQDVLETLFIKEDNRVKEAMQKITKSRIDLILVLNNERKLLGVLNDRIIKNFLLNGGNINDEVEKAMVKNPDNIGKTTDDPKKISEILLSGVNRLPIVDEQGKLIDVEFRVEEVKEEVFPVLRGRAPLRISFAGGGTDIPYFFEKYGGVVISGTIDKYCYATIVKRADRKIIIDSDLTPETDINVDSLDDLEYDGRFDLIKAIIKIMKPDFGFELYLHNDIPPGRGLGSSASLSVLITSLLCYLQNIKYDDYKIAEIAYKAEREELKIKGGWQDQYAAVTGGFNFMEFDGEKTLIYPLRLKEEIVNELNHHIFLCYVGKSHFSGELHQSQEQYFQINEEETTAHLNELKRIAIEIKECLLTNELRRIGELLHESWERKKRVSEKISNPKIDELYEAGLKNGALGGKLLGAGGGGYILFFFVPEKRNKLKKALEKAGGEIINFNFECKGTQIWAVKNMP